MNSSELVKVYNQDAMEEESPMILPGIHFAYDVGDEPEEEDDEVRDSQSEDDDEDQDDILIVQGEEDYDD